MCKKIHEGCLVSMLCFVATLFIGSSLAYAQHQYPTDEVPTAEPAYLAKVKTAAPDPL